jgi:hypothetical protein
MPYLCSQPTEGFRDDDFTYAKDHADAVVPLNYQLDEGSKPRGRKNLIGCRIDYFAAAP